MTFFVFYILVIDQDVIKEKTYLDEWLWYVTISVISDCYTIWMNKQAFPITPYCI